MTLRVRTRGAPKHARSRADKRHRQDRQLTDAQELFIARYLVSFNATSAYLESHPAASRSTARTEGSRLYRDPRIALQIKRAVKDTRERLQASSDRSLWELSAIALSSIADVFDSKGNLIPPHELPRDVSLAVKSIRMRSILGPLDPATGVRTEIGRTVEVVMNDKIQALRLLGEHYGLFKRDADQTQENDRILAGLEAGAARARNLRTESGR